MYKGTFRLSSHTPHAYKVSYELLHIVFLLFKSLVIDNQLNEYKCYAFYILRKAQKMLSLNKKQMLICLKNKVI